MGLFRSGTGPVRPGIDVTNLAIGPFNSAMDERLVSHTRIGLLRSDIGLHTHDFGPIILLWALSCTYGLRPLWHGMGPLGTGTGPLRLGTGPPSSNRALAGKNGPFG